MTDLLQLTITQLHPTEMAQGLTLFIVAVAGHKSGVEIGRSNPIHAIAEALPLAALEPMVHVPEHHQRQRAVAADLIDGEG
jgi:hypothetical protein